MSVINIYHYDSESDDLLENEDTLENVIKVRPSSPDDTTLELFDILNERLQEICNLSCVGLNSFRIEFFDTNFKLEDKKTRCDFDVDDYNIPIMIDGGQNFIAPYLNQLSEIYDDLKGCSFETNKNITFKI